MGMRGGAGEHGKSGALVVVALLAGCASSAGTGSFFAEEWNACPHVFTAADTQALHDAGRALQGTDACAFDGVYVRGSQAVFAFRTADGHKAEAMLQPAACVQSPPSNAVVAGPYVLRQAAGASAVCPQAMSALSAAVRDGRLPPPTRVEDATAAPAADASAPAAAPTTPAAEAAPAAATPEASAAPAASP